MPLLVSCPPPPLPQPLPLPRRRQCHAIARRCCFWCGPCLCAIALRTSRGPAYPHQLGLASPHVRTQRARACVCCRGPAYLRQQVASVPANVLVPLTQPCQSCPEDESNAAVYAIHLIRTKSTHQNKRGPKTCQ